MTARDIGEQWEQAALAHLQRSGLRLLERNFQCRHGEIDLIVQGRDDIAFVEVRYRRSPNRGDGVASVGAAKRSKLIRTAQTWLQMHPQHAQSPCRFDVIGCSGSLESPQFDWTRNAFDAFST